MNALNFNINKINNTISIENHETFGISSFAKFLKWRFDISYNTWEEKVSEENKRFSVWSFINWINN